MNAATPTAYLEELDLSFMAVLDYEDWDAGEVVDSILDAGFDSVEWSMSHVDSLRAPASALACQQDLVTGGEAAVEAPWRANERAVAHEFLGHARAIRGDPAGHQPGRNQSGRHLAGGKILREGGRGGQQNQGERLEHAAFLVAHIRGREVTNAAIPCETRPQGRS